LIVELTSPGPKHLVLEIERQGRILRGPM
jgi:hypothetical protein